MLCLSRSLLRLVPNLAHTQKPIVNPWHFRLQSLGQSLWCSWDQDKVKIPLEALTFPGSCWGHVQEPSASRELVASCPWAILRRGSVACLDCASP